MKSCFMLHSHKDTIMHLHNTIEEHKFLIQRINRKRALLTHCRRQRDNFFSHHICLIFLFADLAKPRNTIPGVSCRVPRVSCHVTGVSCHVPGVSCRVPGVSCRVPGVSCRVPGVSCRVSANAQMEVINKSIALTS